MYILYLKAQMAFLCRVKLGKPFQDAHILRRHVSHEKKALLLSMILVG